MDFGNKKETDLIWLKMFLIEYTGGNILINGFSA